MYIFEIIKPGTWLNNEDRDWSWKIEGILRGLEGQFYEANLALNMFIQAQSIKITAPENWDAHSNRRREIQREVESKYPLPHDREVWETIHLESEILFKKEQWHSGKLPREFEHNQVFMHARAFLYALDSFDRFLEVLKNQLNVPKELEDIHSQFKINFPELREVRNSAHHMEDRSRGLGIKSKHIDLKPIDNELIKAENGALVLNSLNGSKYGNTMADGHYGQVDVSPESMAALHNIFQGILNSFEWKGAKSHLPSL